MTLERLETVQRLAAVRKKWEKKHVCPHEKIIRRGGNQYGQYVIIRTADSKGFAFWRTWINRTYKQVLLGRRIPKSCQHR